MSSSQHIEDSLIRHQIYLIRAAGTTTKEVQSLLKELLKNVQDKLKNSTDGTYFTITNLLRVQKDIEQMAANLKIKENVSDSLDAFTQNEISYYEKLLSSSTSADIMKTSPELVYNTISKKPMTLYGFDGSKQITTLDGLVNTFTASIPRDISRTIQLGITEGATVNQMARAVRAKVESRSMRQAQALVRTATSHVTGQARSQVAKANSDVIEEEEWVSTLDSRVTIFCALTDGKRFPIGEGPQTPAHYNCRSVRVPKIKDKYGLSGLEGERGYVTLDKDGNEVRGVVTGATRYEGWLHRQPKAFQDEMLGPKRAKLFRSGKLELDGFLDENYRIISLKELNRLE